MNNGTFLGGSGFDEGGGDYDRAAGGVAVDSNRRVYVTGETQSSDWPTTPATFDASYNGGDTDAFAAKLTEFPWPCFYLPLVARNY